MAHIESVIYSRLSGYAGLTALVGTRIYPNFVPQNTAAPCVSFQLVASVEPQAMGAGTGVIRSRFQFSVFVAKDNLLSGKNVMAQVKAALKRYRDSGSSPVVQDTFFLNEVDIYDSETEEHQLIVDFEIIYQES